MYLQFHTPVAERIAHIVYHLEQSQFRHSSEQQKSRAFVLLAKNLMQTSNLFDDCEFIEARNFSDVSAIRLLDESIGLSVLVSVQNARTLKQAYPNFFGSTRQFTKFINENLIVEKGHVLSMAAG